MGKIIAPATRREYGIENPHEEYAEKALVAYL
jgi:hypothetical protein